MRIGLIDVDGHNFPNFALMKISAYHKKIGDNVEWCDPIFGEYDIVYASKIFTFSSDFNFCGIRTSKIIKGGTGYNVKSRLPLEIDELNILDYSIYPQYPFSVQFFSRGCIRNCGFCLVREKEGIIRSVTPHSLNENGKWIEVLDNNFFANNSWRISGKYLLDANLPINFHGVDVRILDEEQCEFLNKIRLKKGIHIAWDFPEVDLTSRLKMACKYVNPYKFTCYILVGFNSTIEQDLRRIDICRGLGINPFIMPYRDFSDNNKPSQYSKDLARWVNNKIIFKSTTFEEFSPRKGFKCKSYLTK